MIAQRTQNIHVMLYLLADIPIKAGADLENFKTASLLKLKKNFRAARAFRY